MAVTRASNQERLPFLSQFRIEKKKKISHVNKGRTQKIQMDPLVVFNTKKKSFNLKVRDHKKKKGIFLLLTTTNERLMSGMAKIPSGKNEGKCFFFPYWNLHLFSASLVLIRVDGGVEARMILCKRLHPGKGRQAVVRQIY